MAQMSVNGLTFGYEENPELVFDRVNFSVDTDWKLGLVGRNGKGKTTFLRLLRGELEYGGSIVCPEETEVFPWTVERGNRPTIEVMEEQVPGCELWRVCVELEELGLSSDVLYREYETLSPGEQTKLQLAVLFSREHCYLLLDEPTNHLDWESREQLGEYLKKKKGFLLVSHDRALLDACTDHILAFNREGIQVERGNFSTWWENRRRRESFEESQDRKLRREMRQLQEAAARTEGWSDQVEKSKKGQGAGGAKVDRGYVGHKAAKMMKRSLVIRERSQTALEEKKKLLKNREEQEPLKIFPLQPPREIVLSMRKVSLGYGERTVLEEFSLEVKRGERILLLGRNGSGKSSLLQAVRGKLAPQSGVLEMSSGLVISYVPQRTDWMRGSLEEYLESQQADGTLVRAVLRKLDFSREQFSRRLEELSAGQRKKLLLACSLCSPAHLYLWDEPCNYVDVFSRMQLEELLAASGATMLMVEHDRAFAQRVATRQVRLDIGE